MNNTFQIFKRITRVINPTKGNLLFLLMIFFAFISSQFQQISYYAKYPAILSMIVYLIYHLTEFTRYQYLSGEFTGSLVFNENNVVINERKIEISEFKEIYLRIDDYEGRDRGSIRYISKSKSNGTNNLLFLTLKTKEVIKVFFKMEFMQYEALKPFIISLIKNKIITFEKGIELLKIDDDYFIDKFKKELNNIELE